MDLTKEELHLLECYRCVDDRGKRFLLDMAAFEVKLVKETKKELFSVIDGGCDCE